MAKDNTSPDDHWGIESTDGSHQVTWRGRPVGGSKDTREEAENYLLRLKDRYPHGANVLVGIFRTTEEIQEDG